MANLHNNSKGIKRFYWKEYVWVISFLKPYKLHVVLLILFGAILAVGQLIIPKAFQYLIDDIAPGELGTFYSILIGVALTILLMIAATGGRNYQERLIGEYAARDLQYAMFHKLRQLGFSYVEQHHTGEILSLLHTDVSDVQKIYRAYFPRIVLHLIMIVLLGIMLLYMNWLLALIIVPCYVLYYVIGPWVEKQAFIYLKKYNDDRVLLEKHVYETMSSMQELRAYDGLKWRVNVLFDRFKGYNKNHFHSVFYAHLRGSVRRFTVYLAILILFWLGALQISAGQLTVGEFVAFFFYFFLMINTVTFLVTNLTEQQALMIQASRLYSFDQNAVHVQEMEQPISLHNVEGTVTFNNVSFGYDPSSPILIDLNLSIKGGESVAIVGESGCGKSTLLKLIGRFYDPQQGEVLLDGVPIRSLSFEQLRNSLGFVFQDCYLFGSSVKENIRFGFPNATDEEIMTAAKQAYAHDFIEQLPQGYDTLVGERGYKLSGGQKQRIAIARMFIKNPKVVILDEATSALDNESEAYIHKAIAELGKDRTTIIVAHRLSTVENSDRIVVMDQGEIIEQGTYEELMRKNGAFRRLAQDMSREEQADVS